MEARINFGCCLLTAYLAHQLFLLLTALEEIEKWGKP
jgi:hypothetical protein